MNTVELNPSEECHRGNILMILNPAKKGVDAQSIVHNVLALDDKSIGVKLE